MFGGTVDCSTTTTVQIDAAHIKQSKHFKISGLEGFTYKHGCFANDYNYRFIGSKPGLLRLSKKLAILNPHFFVVQADSSPFPFDWRIAAFGKFYPCSDEQGKEFNAGIKVTDDDKTVIEVKDLKTFNPVWPHHYLADHGEPLSSIYVFDLEKYMHFTPSTRLTATLDDSKYEITVEDDKLQLKTHPDSNSALLALGRFSIENKKYSKEVIMTQRTQEEKRNFLKTFFPTTIPFAEIPAGNFMNNLLSNISSIGV